MISNLSNEYTLVILAGGESRRLNNLIKALENFKGKSLLGHRIILSNILFQKIIVSVSSHHVKRDCEDRMISENIDLSKVSFFIDDYDGHGPMKALYDIFPKIITKYCTVIGVDNPLIRNIDVQHLQKELIQSQASLISVLINKTNLIASFFAINVQEINETISINPFTKDFDRITDLFRIVPKIALLELPEIGQFTNINTSNELKSLETAITNYLEPYNCFTIKPNHFATTGVICISFLKELECWSNPYFIKHIIRNILKDAKRELRDRFNECKFNDYMKRIK